MAEENEFGSKRIIAGCVAYVSTSPVVKVPSGITFVLTAANIPLSKYTSICRALNSKGEMVVGYMINVWNPVLKNHRTKAQNVRDMFDELKNEVKTDWLGFGLGGGFAVDRFDVVGHGVGGEGGDASGGPSQRRWGAAASNRVGSDRSGGFFWSLRMGIAFAGPGRVAGAD